MTSSELKALIKINGFRPGVRECFRNCQYILLAAQRTELKNRLSYHEGWVVNPVPVPHAWLVLDGVIQDPTLTDRCPSDYGQSNVYSAKQIREHIVSTGFWSAVDYAAIQELMFGKERMAMLKQMHDKSTACPKCEVGGGYHVVGCELKR